MASLNAYSLTETHRRLQVLEDSLNEEHQREALRDSFESKLNRMEQSLASERLSTPRQGWPREPRGIKEIPERRRELLKALFAGLDHNANGVVLASEILSAGDAFLASGDGITAVWDAEKHAVLVQSLIISGKASEIPEVPFLVSCDRCFPEEKEEFVETVAGYLRAALKANR